MRTLSHLMVTLSTLMLLLFGSGGIGWQRCACSGKVSLVLPIQQGCCKNGSSCMKVTIKHLSISDQQPERVALPQLADNALFCIVPRAEAVPLPLTHTEQLSGYTYWYPPGWVATQGMVMRV